MLILGAARVRGLFAGLSLHDGMTALVSTVVLLAAIALIFGDSSQDNQKWAYGAVGSILGYWLKPPAAPPRRTAGDGRKRAAQPPSPS